MLASFIQDLRKFDLTAYERSVQLHGRLSLTADTSIVRQFRSLTDAAATILDTKAGYPEALVGPGRQTSRHSVQIAYNFLDSQHHMLSDAERRYDHYASIPLLRYLLHVDRKITLAARQRQVWHVFQELIAAQVAFEKAALAGRSPFPAQDFRVDVANARLSALATLQQTVPSNYIITSPPTCSAVATSDLLAMTEIGGERDVIRRLLTFPQTTCHDETAFIRLIQLAECLFWGALINVTAALADLRRRQYENALSEIHHASMFATPLVRVFHVVRTMPPEHFLGFRETTDHASAIQSLSWQLLDAHVYGVLPEKAAILAAIPTLSEQIRRLQRPQFIPLLQAVRGVTDSSAAAQLNDAAIELDRGLRAWRRFHEKQLAGRTNPSYLPPGALGTGGTSGYGYLASQKPPRLTPIVEATRSPSQSAAPYPASTTTSSA